MQLYLVGSRLDQAAKFLGGNDGKHVGSIGEAFIQRRDQLLLPILLRHNPDGDRKDAPSFRRCSMLVARYW